MLSALIRSVHSYPAMPLARQLVHQRYVHPGPLVLRAAPLKFPTPATDRDRTVSRRSEPSSRTTVMGEQPNPWDQLQPQDVMSRHRGAKPPRRCGLVGEISLLSHCNGRTAQPLGPTTAPGCDEPTSRCQTSPSMWTRGGDKPVVPRGAFIRCALALPLSTTGALSPEFYLARPEWLAI